MNELEQIRQRRLQELQQKQQQQMQEEVKLQQQLTALEELVKTKLTREAIQRYGNIKAAHPDKAVQLLAFLGQMIQTGKLTETITDEKLKIILNKLTPQKRDISIKRM
jgi:programmed cell death protein 5